MFREEDLKKVFEDYKTYDGEWSALLFIEMYRIHKLPFCKTVLDLNECEFELFKGLQYIKIYNYIEKYVDIDLEDFKDPYYIRKEIFRTGLMGLEEEQWNGTTEDIQRTLMYCYNILDIYLDETPHTSPEFQHYKSSLQSISEFGLGCGEDIYLWKPNTCKGFNYISSNFLDMDMEYNTKHIKHNHYDEIDERFETYQTLTKFYYEFNIFKDRLQNEVWEMMEILPQELYFKIIYDHKGFSTPLVKLVLENFKWGYVDAYCYEMKIQSDFPIRLEEEPNNMICWDYKRRTMCHMVGDSKNYITNLRLDYFKQKEYHHLLKDKFLGLRNFIDLESTYFIREYGADSNKSDDIRDDPKYLKYSKYAGNPEGEPYDFLFKGRNAYERGIAKGGANNDEFLYCRWYLSEYCSSIYLL